MLMSAWDEVEDARPNTRMHVGDILFTQPWEVTPFFAKLFIVYWDAARGQFTKRSIDLQSRFPYHTFEHVTFAPTNIPDL